MKPAKPGRKLGESTLNLMTKLFQEGSAMMQALADDDTLDARFHRSRNYDNLYNLKRRGYVIEKVKGNKSFFHLTPKGRLSVLKYLHLEKFRRSKWDGRWRIIIFDIPEDQKKWRERLRARLKSLGFRALQESVYIIPYPVLGELDQFLEERRFRKYFRYITVFEIDGEDELKKKFGLL